MATDVQIKCVNKDNRNDPTDSIDYVGGVNADGTRWKLSLADAVKGVENGTWRFYTHVNGKSVWVVVAVSAAGNKYLKTEADGKEENNLLSLPECP